MQDVPRSVLFDDVYFSADDGPGETAHVFLDGNNLPARWQGAQRFVIGETGFGTGLNFLLAWELFDRTAPQGAMLDFVSVEKFPLSVDEIRQGLLPWADRLSPYLEKMLAKYPMRVPGFHRVVFDNRVVLTLIFDDANDALAEIEGQVDAWFLDGFTPAKNPAMWTDKVFREMARLSHAQTSFATFTSAGFVKRGLQNAGFSVEKARGFGRKRDMLLGRFLTGVKSSSKKKTVAIKGAGLAGTAAAYVLPQYGFDVSLYDLNGIASGASGNSIGIINPRLSAFRTAESDFHTAAFAMVAREFQCFKNVEYDRCGSVHLVTDVEKEKKFLRSVEHWGWHAGHMAYVSNVSDIAGTRIDQAALYLPEGGRISPAKLCDYYAQNVQLGEKEADVVIDARGAALGGGDLPVHAVRGQVTFAHATSESIHIKTNLCYGGYCSPAQNGIHAIGSTFQKWISDTKSVPEDDCSNLEKLAQAIPHLTGFKIIGSRAGLRLSAQDHFPIVGPVENYYLTTAYGSHGIIGSLLGAHILADYLRGGPFSVGKSTLNALAGHRFILRKKRHSVV